MRLLTVAFMIIVCLARPVAAQVVVKEGNIYLHDHSKVSVQGELINNGNILNKGTLSVTGDWKNLSSYTSSGGTIALNGSDAQVFFHNGQAVGILLIANPTYIYLASDVSVEKKLVLEKGVVIPEAGSKLIMAEEAKVEGGAPNAYIAGKMYHTGAGSKFYPIGKYGQYAPVTLSQLSGENPVVGVEFYDRSVQALQANDMLLQEFYWHFSSLSGNFEGSPVTLDVLLENNEWEENLLVIAGSEHVEEPFTALDKPNVQIQDGRFIFSSSKSLRSQFITIGNREGLNEVFYVPNALSPSAPHPEDQAIKIYSKSIKPDGFRWTIWDNWGQVVYTNNSYEQASATGWQGTYAGKGEAQPGIYKYFLQGTFMSGQTFSKKGTIILYK